MILSAQENMPEEPAKKGKRGFASMDAEKQKAIASKGGRAAHAQGKAHQFSSDEAREAGRKGGTKAAENRIHMQEIGRKGGRARGQIAKIEKEAKADGQR